MTSYLDNGYDVMKYFAKFENFVPHSIIIPSFMTIGSQLPELDWGDKKYPIQIRVKLEDHSLWYFSVMGIVQKTQRI